MLDTGLRQRPGAVEHMLGLVEEGRVPGFIAEDVLSLVFRAANLEGLRPGELHWFWGRAAKTLRRWFATAPGVITISDH